MVKHKPKILITGGAGFIGSHLAESLVRLGYRVFIVDNLSKGKIENVNKEASFFKTDIKSKRFPEIINRIKPEYIFHFAAQSSLSKSVDNPKDDLKINFLTVVDTLNSAKKAKVKKIIFASSAAIYGPSRFLPIGESHPKSPSSPYGIAKLASEHFIKHFYEYHNLPYTTLRFANVYGQRQDTTAEGGVVGIFIQKILNKQPVVIYGSGKQTRDFIHVSDIVKANVAALENHIVGEFNVGTGKQTTINDLFAIIAEISGSKPDRIFSSGRDKEVKKNALSPKKLKKTAGWKVETSLKQGLKLTFDYFKLQK